MWNSASDQAGFIAISAQCRTATVSNRYCGGGENEGSPARYGEEGEGSLVTVAKMKEAVVGTAQERMFHLLPLRLTRSRSTTRRRTEEEDEQCLPAMNAVEPQLLYLGYIDSLGSSDEQH